VLLLLGASVVLKQQEQAEIREQLTALVNI
jgi:hypothetical protein